MSLEVGAGLMFHVQSSADASRPVRLPSLAFPIVTLPMRVKGGVAMVRFRGKARGRVTARLRIRTRVRGRGS